MGQWNSEMDDSYFLRKMLLWKSIFAQWSCPSFNVKSPFFELLLHFGLLFSAESQAGGTKALSIFQSVSGKSVMCSGDCRIMCESFLSGNNNTFMAREGQIASNESHSRVAESLRQSVSRLIPEAARFKPSVTKDRIAVSRFQPKVVHVRNNLFDQSVETLTIYRTPWKDILTKNETIEIDWHSAASVERNFPDVHFKISLLGSLIYLRLCCAN
jgi:hypothetical protein